MDEERVMINYRKMEWETACWMGSLNPHYTHYIEHDNPCIAYSLDGTWWGLVMYPRSFEDEYGKLMFERLRA